MRSNQSAHRNTITTREKEQNQYKHTHTHTHFPANFRVSNTHVGLTLHSFISLPFPLPLCCFLFASCNKFVKQKRQATTTIGHCAHSKLVIAMTFTVVVVVSVVVVMHPLAWVHHLVLPSRSFALPALSLSLSLHKTTLSSICFVYICLP